MTHYPLDMDDIGFIYTVEQLDLHDELDRLMYLIDDGLVSHMTQEERELLICEGIDPDTGKPLDVAELAPASPPPRWRGEPAGKR